MMDHVSLVRELWSDPRFCTLMTVIWVASFGSALHAPVSTFFYLGVGATESDIGRIGAIMSLSSIVTAPWYGSLADKRGHAPIFALSVALCGVGCGIRGFATNVAGLYVFAVVASLGAGQFWTVGLSFLTAHYGDDGDDNDDNNKKKRRQHFRSESSKSILLSGFFAQVAALRLLGKLCFPILDGTLRSSWLSSFRWFSWSQNDLTRWRFELGICTLFCMYGIVALAYDSDPMRAADAMRLQREASAQQQQQLAIHNKEEPTPLLSAGQDEEQQQPLTEDNDKASGTTSSTATNSATAYHSSSVIDKVPFALSLVLLLCQSTGGTIAKVLWPLYCRDAFGWSAPEYSGLVFASSAMSIAAVALFPKLDARWGSYPTGVVACVVATAAALGGFNIDLSSSNGEGNNIEPTVTAAQIAIHTVLAILLAAADALLEPCIKAIALRWVTAHSAQGRAFGAMGAVVGAGAVVGNLFGTELYSIEKNERPRLEHRQGPLLPFLFCSVLFVCAALILLVLLFCFTGSSSYAPVVTSDENGGILPSSHVEDSMLGGKRVAESPTKIRHNLQQRHAKKDSDSTLFSSVELTNQGDISIDGPEVRVYTANSI